MTPASHGRRRALPLILVGLAVTFALALLVAPWASGDPDGLNKVADETGISSGEKEHPLKDGPLAGYSVDGVEGERLSTGLSGMIGVAITFVVAASTFALLRRARARRAGSN